MRSTPHPWHEYFATYLEHLPAYAGAYDSRGRLIWGNDLLLGSLARRFGLAVDGVVGRSVSEITGSPEEAAIVHDTLVKVRSTGAAAPVCVEVSTGEARRVLAGCYFPLPGIEDGTDVPLVGTLLLDVTDYAPLSIMVARAVADEDAVGGFSREGRWLEAAAAPLHESGEVVGVIGIAMDIHDLAEQERRFAEDRFAAFMDSSPVMAAIRDEQGRLLWVNRAYRDELEPHLRDREAGSFAEVLRASSQRVVASGVPVQVREQFQRLGGEVGHLRGFVFPIATPGGGTGVGTVLMDVTMQQQIQERLFAAEERSRTLFDRTPVPMLVLDGSGTVLDGNAALTRLAGASLSALRGSALTNLLRPLHPLDAEVLLRLLLDDNAPTSAYGAVCVWPGAAPAMAMVTLVNLAGDVKMPSTVVAVIQPVSTPLADDRLHLSAKEANVLELRAQGRSIAQTATRLGISRSGVDYQLAQIARRFRCDTNVTEVVARAYHLGVLDRSAWPPTVSPNFRTI